MKIHKSISRSNLFKISNILSITEKYQFIETQPPQSRFIVLTEN